MIRQSALLSAALVSFAAAPAFAILNEFSIADGYSGAFATPVWTYHPRWSFDGGAAGSNYVAQHGYGSGFPFGEPFGLVIRNDVPSSSYQFSYSFESADLGGVNPSNAAGTRVTIEFDVNPVFNLGGSIPNNAPMLTMAFGGTRTNPAMRIAFSDSNRLMFSNGSNVLTEYVGFTPTGGAWNKVTLNLDFTTNTYDLLLHQMTGSGANASNTWTIINTFPVATGMPFANSTSVLEDLWFETFTDPENNLGFSKSYLDHFTSSSVPAPSAAMALGLGGLLVSRRRR